MSDIEPAGTASESNPGFAYGGGGGWTFIRTVNGAGRKSEGYVRFKLAGDRLVPCEVYLPACTSARELSSFPLAQAEASANTAHGRQSITFMMDEPGPLLNVAASYFTTRGKPPGWVGDMMISQNPDSDIEWVAAKPKRAFHRVVDRPIDARLDVPVRRPYGDDFYRQVAGVYAALAQRFNNPACRIADANEKTTTVVHRWVHEARRRGFLAPGAKGKRG